MSDALRYNNKEYLEKLPKLFDKAVKALEVSPKYFTVRNTAIVLPYPILPRTELQIVSSKDLLVSDMFDHYPLQAIVMKASDRFWSSLEVAPWADKNLKMHYPLPDARLDHMRVCLKPNRLMLPLAFDGIELYVINPEDVLALVMAGTIQEVGTNPKKETN